MQQAANVALRLVSGVLRIPLGQLLWLLVPEVLWLLLLRPYYLPRFYLRQGLLLLESKQVSV